MVYYPAHTSRDHRKWDRCSERAAWKKGPSLGLGTEEVLGDAKEIQG